MNILLYSEFFYPITGGTQSFVLELARGLGQSPAANSVTVVTRTPARPAAHSPADASSSPVAADAYPFSVVRRPGLRALWKFIRRADLVHVAGPALSPMALSVLARKRFVVEHHGCQVACPNGLLFFEPTQSPCPGHYMARRYSKCLACNRKSVGLAKSLRMLLLTPVRRWLANRAARNIMPTAWLAGVLRLNRAATVHHGVASPAQVSSPLPPATAVGTITFAFQGRLVSTKGVATLLAAAAQLHAEGRAFRLKILGDGPELRALKSRAAFLGDKVEFLGHVPDDCLDAVFAGVAAVVMPSLGGEVFGLVAAESMRRAKLVIVSDLGALVEVVGDSGLIFPAGDADALAACMRRVLDDPTLALTLGAAACARAQELFSVERMLDRHVALYHEVAR